MHSMRMRLPWSPCPDKQREREREGEGELYALHDISWQKWRKYDNDDNVTAPNIIGSSIDIDH